MNERQEDGFSRKRENLIKKMERENPLRRIADADHARAILAASDRHHSGYDSYLEVARDLALIGEIDRGDVKAWARENYAKSI